MRSPVGVGVDGRHAAGEERALVRDHPTMLDEQTFVSTSTVGRSVSASA